MAALARPSRIPLFLVLATVATFVVFVLLDGGSGESTSVGGGRIIAPSAAGDAAAETTGADDQPCRVHAAVQPGASGADVRCLLERLAELGYDVSSTSARFDEQAIEALRAFQRDINIAADGIAGPVTLTSLELWPGGAGSMTIDGGQVHAVGEGQVALTFDDGPGPFTTPILDILDHYGVDATFFVVGASVAGNEPTLTRLLDEGHSLQNHTWRHRDLAESTWFRIHTELSAASDAIEAATGHRPSCYRPPEGSTDVMVRTVGREIGLYPEVMWNVNPDDYRNDVSAAELTSASLASADGRGLIIGLHDGGGDRSSTVAALPDIISGLRERGYEFVTLC